MDVYGSDSAPDEEAAGTGRGEASPDVGSWFQRGSGNEAALNDRGVGVPVNTMLDRVREADALTFENEASEG
jgi:hypothetical protein